MDSTSERRYGEAEIKRYQLHLLQVPVELARPRTHDYRPHRSGSLRQPGNFVKALSSRARGATVSTKQALVSLSRNRLVGNWQERRAGDWNARSETMWIRQAASIPISQPRTNNLAVQELAGFRHTATSL